jgi:hypothetical protein
MIAGVNRIVLPLQKQVPDEETIPLTVRVLRDDGAAPSPFPKIDVLVYKERPAAEHQVTDDQGEARFKLTGAGNYVAVASAKGYAPGEARVQVKTGQPNLAVVTLKKTTGTSARLTVTVYRGEGKGVAPLVGATVLAYEEGGPSGHPLTDLSDEHGVAEFELLGSRRYVVAARLPGYLPAETRVQVAEGELGTASLILYPKPAEIPLNVTVYRMKGRSRLPLAGAEVTAFRYDRRGGERSRHTTDAEGRVSFQLADGEGVYVVAAMKDGFRSDAKPVPVHSGTENQAYLSLSALDDVGPEVPPTFTVRVLAGSIGRMMPAEGARVLLRHERGTARDMTPAATDAKGMATLHPAAPGMYDVVVSKEGYAPRALRVRITRDVARETEIILTSAGPTPSPAPTVPSAADTATKPIPEPAQPSFAACDRPGWIHVTRLVRLSDQRSRSGDGFFTAEFWLQEKSPGRLSGDGKYVYYKLDPSGGGSKGEKTFTVQGTIQNERVTVEGDGDMEVVGFGTRSTREPVVVWDFMRKFDGTMVDDIYTQPPSDPITKYNVVYVVSKTVIQRCAGVQPVPSGIPFAGLVIERPSTSYPTQKFPVAGARVKVVGSAAGQAPAAEAITDGVGTFVIPNAPAGNCTVTVSATGHDLLTESHVISMGMVPPVLKLQPTGLPPHEIAPITGKVELNVLVRDAVNKDKPVSGAVVTLFDKNQFGLGFAANSGRFDTFLTPGSYRYRASAPGYSAKEEGFAAGGATTPTGAAYQDLTIYLTPSGSKPPVHAGAKTVEVKLEGLTRESKVAIAPGDRLRLLAAMGSNNPFVINLREFDRDRLTLVADRTEHVEPGVGPGGRPLLGAPSERHVYEFLASERATGDARVVVELRRPWERTPSIRYTLVVAIGSDRTNK